MKIGVAATNTLTSVHADRGIPENVYIEAVDVSRLSSRKVITQYMIGKKMIVHAATPQTYANPVLFVLRFFIVFIPRTPLL